MDDRLLIVTADDFALTGKVSEGIIHGHENGVITSTSVLALGPAFESSMKLLRDHPELDAGVHLALVGEDPPLLPPSQIPTLCRGGALPPSWRSFVVRALAGRIDPQHVRAELRAQVDRVVAAGIRVAHINAHQHLQLWPPVGTVVMELARELGVPMRIPNSQSAGGVGYGVRFLARRLEREATNFGIAYPRESAGLDEAGSMTAERFQSALSRIASTGAANAEIVVHPGAPDDPERARYKWGYSWEEELRVLEDSGVREKIDSLGFTLGGYSKLLPAAT